MLPDPRTQFQNYFIISNTKTDGLCSKRDGSLDGIQVDTLYMLYNATRAMIQRCHLECSLAWHILIQ